MQCRCYFFNKIKTMLKFVFVSTAIFLRHPNPDHATSGDVSDWKSRRTFSGKRHTSTGVRLKVNVKCNWCFSFLNQFSKLTRVGSIVQLQAASVVENLSTGSAAERVLVTMHAVVSFQC